MAKRMGIPLWAAKKGDMCLHKGTVQSGSPDTTIEGKPAARLSDKTVCRVHFPPPMKGLGDGKIVTASSTVYINRLGAARKTDLCQCKMPGSAPPGTASPQTKSYEVRGADHYQKLMVVEHEVAAWDKVRDIKEADLGKVGEADDPLGVKDASPPVRRPPSDQSFNASGKAGDKKAFKDVQAPAGAPVVKPGSGNGGALAGQSPAGSPSGGGGQAAGGAKDAALPEQTARKKEDKRKKQDVSVDLAPSIDLSVGSRGTSFFAGLPMDIIEPRTSTVYIGGAGPPSLDVILKEREKEKKAGGGK
jgi:uncharacterized Zn-binding protein involved in type VI secretion